MYKKTTALMLLGMLAAPIASNAAQWNSPRNAGIYAAFGAGLGITIAWYARYRHTNQKKIEPKVSFGKNDIFNWKQSEVQGRLNLMCALLTGKENGANDIEPQAYAAAAFSMIGAAIGKECLDVSINLPESQVHHALLKKGVRYYINPNNELLCEDRTSPNLVKANIKLPDWFAAALKNAPECPGTTQFSINADLSADEPINYTSKIGNPASYSTWRICHNAKPIAALQQQQQ